MKVEIHCHTRRYSICATAKAEEMLEGLIRAGYEAVYLTEHDSVWPAEDLADLQARFPAIRVFPGVELSRGGCHIVVLGSGDPSYLAMADPLAVLDHARAIGDLTILAHPYRWEGGDDILRQGLRPDAIEYRTCNVDAEQAERAIAKARELSVAAVNAGDAHGLGFLDRFWIETGRPLKTAKDIRNVVISGEYANRSREGG